VKFPILDFSGTAARPALSGPVAVSTFAVSLAVGTFLFVRYIFDGRIRQIGCGRLTRSRAITVCATTATATIIADTTVWYAERAVFRVVSSLALLVACTGSQSGGRCECYEIPSFHVVLPVVLDSVPLPAGIGEETKYSNYDRFKTYFTLDSDLRILGVEN
jgi:hypothetical protein